MRDTFQTPSGKMSSTRIEHFLVVVIFMVTWAVISVQRGYMIPVSGGIIAIFGIISGQRGVQYFAERGIHSTPKDDVNK